MSIFNLVSALRLHQWMKNILIFVPLLAAHKFNQTESLFEAFRAFVTFSITASGVYVINDLIDAKEDQAHHRKMNRPFASGAISRKIGHMMWIFLILLAGVLAVSLHGRDFCITLLVYFLLTLAYSLKLKQIAILDVLVLSAFYTLRIIAGAAAIGVIPSFWLLTFSMFFFLSLAMMKRFIEIGALKGSGKVLGKGYSSEDATVLFSLGTSTGYISILVLALYIQDQHTIDMYAEPRFIWLACPILLFWISRSWFLAHRGMVHEDPIVFALQDRISLLLAVAVIFVFTLAKFGGEL